MTITLYDTKARKKREFTPLNAEDVRMYVCGPTVYDRAHLGNARPVVVFDVLYRLLRHTYGAEHVTYVRNFTDVDDRINETALNRKRDGDTRSLEALIAERSDETIAWYEADMGALGALPPTHAPRATAYIAQMVTMIAELIAAGHAYEAEGHVLFAVDNWRKHYGALSGRSVDDMIAGARVEVAPYKKNPMDFVLWKPSTDELPGWESPWGRGRPGWHIECSAMARDILGERFDIHAGGLDLQFPHHENEIAQSCCTAGPDSFAQYWLHNEMLQVEGKKMSKSLGNFFTVRDLLDKGVPGEVIRFVFLQTHYRKPMDWTEKKRAEAEATLRKWAALVNDRPAVTREWNVPGKKIDAKVNAALADDLNTHAALKRLHELFSEAREVSNDGNAALAKLFYSLRDLLGIDLESLHEKLRPRTLDDAISELELGHAYNLATSRQVIAGLVAERDEAKAQRDFDKADAIREKLTKAGILITDKAHGADWDIGVDFDPSKLGASE